jgi:large subunit ribosomal protein L24
MASRVRKGDLVAVISGDDRGKRGRVLRILREEGRVIVEGVNLVYKHLRRSQEHPQGGRIRREAPIHLSNVMPIDPESSRPTRIRMEVAEGKRRRVGVRTGAGIDIGGGRKGERKSSGKAEAKE